MTRAFEVFDGSARWWYDPKLKGLQEDAKRKEEERVENDQFVEQRGKINKIPGFDDKILGLGAVMRLQDNIYDTKVRVRVRVRVRVWVRVRL